MGAKAQPNIAPGFQPGGLVDGGFVGSAVRRARAVVAGAGYTQGGGGASTATPASRTAIPRDPRKRTGKHAAPISTPATQSAAHAAANVAADQVRKRAAGGGSY
jgi:hypothetical protein